MMLTPTPMVGPKRVIEIADDFFGERGHALSEYAQLLWLEEHLEEITAGHDYIRLFQYRRFVSEMSMGHEEWNKSWTWISTPRLEEASSDFDRFSGNELFNQIVLLEGGVSFQYAMSHVAEDIVNFAKFLKIRRILNDAEILDFLTSDKLIPACSTGTYKIDTFRVIFRQLRLAAEFLNSEYYNERSGKQRRVGGFLLERLNSYLLIRHIRENSETCKFGQYIMVDDEKISKQIMRRFYEVFYRIALILGDYTQKNVAGVRIGNRVKAVLTDA